MWLNLTCPDGKLPGILPLPQEVAKHTRTFPMTTIGVNYEINKSVLSFYTTLLVVTTSSKLAVALCGESHAGEIHERLRVATYRRLS